MRLRGVARDYDPTDRDTAYAHIRERQREGEVVTGLLYVSPDSQDMLAQNQRRFRIQNRLFLLAGWS